MRDLGRLGATDPERARVIDARGRAVSDASTIGLRAGVGTAVRALGVRGGFPNGGVVGNFHDGPASTHTPIIGGNYGYYGSFGNHHYNHPSYWSNWGLSCSYWGSGFFGFHLGYGYGYGYPWYYGYGYGNHHYYGRGYYSSPWYSYWSPYYTSSFYRDEYPATTEIIIIDNDDDDNVIYIDSGEASTTVLSGEGAAAQVIEHGPEQPSGARALGRAASQYMISGDRAFGEGRYADAVRHYGMAIEFAPNEGILYLVLSDALFATGDYHYSAYCVRRALELEPGIAESIVDKHGFYLDPKEFDRHLAQLEQYLADHQTDDDARLLLAANYLFGNRPAAAVDLLERGESQDVAGTTAGSLILEAARAIQHGR